MKNIKILLSLISMAILASPSFAQYDDIYYNPSDDSSEFYYEDVDETTYDNDIAYNDVEDMEEADDETYDYDYEEYTDNDYYYSSRIRRFNRPVNGLNFYSPFYMNYSYYDRFVNPGVSLFIGGPLVGIAFGGNNWGANRYGSFYGRRSFGRYASANPFNNPYFYGGGSRFNSYGGGGFGGAAYCPPSAYNRSGVFNNRTNGNATSRPRGSNTLNTRNNNTSVRTRDANAVNNNSARVRTNSRTRTSTSGATKANGNLNANTRTRTSRTTTTRANNRVNRAATGSKAKSSNKRSFWNRVTSPRSNSSSTRSTTRSNSNRNSGSVRSSSRSSSSSSSSRSSGSSGRKR